MYAYTSNIIRNTHSRRNRCCEQQKAVTYKRRNNMYHLSYTSIIKQSLSDYNFMMFPTRDSPNTYYERLYDHSINRMFYPLCVLTSHLIRNSTRGPSETLYRTPNTSSTANSSHCSSDSCARCIMSAIMTMAIIISVLLLLSRLLCEFYFDRLLS